MKLENVLKPEERAVFALRALFEERGYSPFRMSRFEEYDLYGKNKDFLVSDSVITFTDTDGRLMALKPDVTLSIIKNARIGSGEKVKVYYNENVFRVSQRTHRFSEIMQAGLECIGSLEKSDIAEVVLTALESLSLLGGSFALSVSHMGLIASAFRAAGMSGALEKKAAEALGSKSVHELERLCAENAIEKEKAALLFALVTAGGRIGDAAERLRLLELEPEALCAVGELEELARELKGSPFEKNVVVDFSAVNDISYYNGIVFSGHLEGVPDVVLSGGSYDKLLNRMGKSGKAIGFAVYLDALESAPCADDESGKEDDGSSRFINVALPKGRLGEKVYKMFADAGYECPSINDPGRKLIFENPEKGVRYFWVKPSDVAIYVERGAADVGVAGKDILLEYSPDVFELADLDVGKCRMCVAAPKSFSDNPEKTLKVATKFVNIAKRYYASIGRDIDIIKLNGSIEIAPILTLSDVIVDIVETGTTLRENDLEVRTEILPISARLIANKTSFRFKGREIGALAEKLGSKQ